MVYEEEENPDSQSCSDDDASIDENGKMLNILAEKNEDNSSDDK